MNRLNNPSAQKAWTDAYAYKAQIEAREVERDQPQPVLTQCALLALSFGMFVLMLVVFGKEPW